MGSIGDGVRDYGEGRGMLGSIIAPEWIRPPRAPMPDDTCRCGHGFVDHSRLDGPCAYRESQFADIARDGPSGPLCGCAKFEFRYGADKARLEKAMKEITALAKSKGDAVTLQDLEAILVKYLTDAPEQVVERFRFRTPITATAGQSVSSEIIIKQMVDKLNLKPVLEGRAKLAVDEEV